MLEVGDNRSGSLKQSFLAFSSVNLQIREILVKTVKCEAASCMRMFTERETEPPFLRRTDQQWAVLSFKMQRMLKDISRFHRVQCKPLQKIVWGSGRWEENYPPPHGLNLPTLPSNYFPFAAALQPFVQVVNRTLSLSINGHVCKWVDELLRIYLSP